MSLSSHVRALSLIFVLAAVIAALVPAAATVTAGANARSVAMGGAGLASGDTQDAVNNPAFLADSPQSFGIIWPSLNANADGVGFSDALKLIGDAKVDAKKALDLLTESGSNASTVDLSASGGLALPRGDLVATAAVHTEVMPNSAFSTWVKDGQSGTPPEGAQADIYSGGLATLPSLGFGFYLPSMTSMPGRTAVGFRIKPEQVFYSHYVFDGTSPTGRPADEMGGKSFLKSSGLAADMGLTFIPQNAPNVHLALVVNNVLQPKAIRFAAPSERFGASKQLAPRTISVGTAWVNENLTLAADLVDLTHKVDNSSLRLGAELRLPSGIALRGGYNTLNGLTAGIGIGGFGVAYSGKTPVMISNYISF